jgi:hypothetical protein
VKINAYTVSVGKPEKKGCLGDIGLEVRIIIKWNFYLKIVAPRRYYNPLSQIKWRLCK